MSQLRLFPHICGAEDDKGVKCQVTMTTQEIEQDGVCCRCADGIHASIYHDCSFIIRNPLERGYL